MGFSSSHLWEKGLGTSIQTGRPARHWHQWKPVSGERTSEKGYGLEGGSCKNKAKSIPLRN